MGNMVKGIPAVLTKNWQPLAGTTSSFRNRITHQCVHKHIVSIDDPQQIRSLKYRMQIEDTYICRVLFYHQFHESIYHVYMQQMNHSLTITSQQSWLSNKIRIVEAFRELAACYGYFLLYERMIGEDRNQNIKVWIHGDVCSHEPWKTCACEQEMVESLLVTFNKIQSSHQLTKNAKKLTKREQLGKNSLPEHQFTFESIIETLNHEMQSLRSSNSPINKKIRQKVQKNHSNTTKPEVYNNKSPISSNTKTRYNISTELQSKKYHKQSQNSQFHLVRHPENNGHNYLQRESKRIMEHQKFRYQKSVSPIKLAPCGNEDDGLMLQNLVSNQKLKNREIPTIDSHSMNNPKNDLQERPNTNLPTKRTQAPNFVKKRNSLLQNPHKSIHTAFDPYQNGKPKPNRTQTNFMRKKSDLVQIVSTNRQICKDSIKDMLRTNPLSNLLSTEPKQSTAASNIKSYTQQCSSSKNNMKRLEVSQLGYKLSKFDQSQMPPSCNQSQSSERVHTDTDSTLRKHDKHQSNHNQQHQHQIPYFLAFHKQSPHALESSNFSMNTPLARQNVQANSTFETGRNYHTYRDKDMSIPKRNKTSCIGNYKPIKSRKQEQKSFQGLLYLPEQQAEMMHFESTKKMIAPRLIAKKQEQNHTYSKANKKGQINLESKNTPKNYHKQIHHKAYRQHTEDIRRKNINPNQIMKYSKQIQSQQNPNQSPSIHSKQSSAQELKDEFNGIFNTNIEQVNLRNQQFEKFSNNNIIYIDEKSRNVTQSDDYSVGKDKDSEAIADSIENALIKEKVMKKRAIFANLKKQAMKILDDDS